MQARVGGMVVSLCAAMLTAAWGAAAEEKPAGKGAELPRYYAIPGHYLLGMEYVQKQLDLVSDQKDKLVAVARKYQDDSQQLWKNADWSKWRELPPEEQRKKYDEVQNTFAKLTADAQQQVEAVLLPHQQTSLRRMELRQRLGGMLYSPAVLEKIGFSDQQKEQLKQLREEQQKKYMQLQEEMMDKTMELLSPVQQQQLEEIGAQGYQSRAVPVKGK